MNKKLFFVLLIASCGTNENDSVNKETDSTKLEIGQIPSTKLIVENDTIKNAEIDSRQNKTESSLEVKVIYSDTIGYGYEIYNDGKLYIRQPIIPAIQGKQGFKSEFDAKKTGEYVKNKIEKGIMPPSITVDELKKLGVVNHSKK